VTTTEAILDEACDAASLVLVELGAFNPFGLYATTDGNGGTLNADIESDAGTICDLLGEWIGEQENLAWAAVVVDVRVRGVDTIMVRLQVRGAAPECVGREYAIVDSLVEWGTSHRFSPHCGWWPAGAIDQERQ